jgi:F0F1-type ATP synthase delta subunit
MNADLNLLLQKLDDCTEDYPADEVLNELRIVCERITFAQIHTDQTAESESLRSDVEYLLSSDISPQVLRYVQYLLGSNMLGILSDQVGQVFIGHCQAHFASIKQLVFKTAISLRDDKKQEFRSMLKQAYPGAVRILFDTDSSLLAGFTIESRDETQDYSLRGRAAKLLSDAIKNQTEGHVWAS